jgi:hypothetical protein
MVDDLGIDFFDLNDFIENCNTEYDKITGEKTKRERIRILDKGYLWVTGFIQFQYKGKEGLVNPNAKPVITALQILSGHGILEDAINKGYVTLTEPLTDFQDGLVTPKVKVKDKDKDVFKLEKNKNGKTTKFVNVAAQREDLLAKAAGRGND